MNNATLSAVAGLAVLILAGLGGLSVINSEWWLCHHPSQEQRQSIAFAYQCWSAGIVDLNGQYLR